MSEGLQIYLAAGVTVGISLMLGGALCPRGRFGWPWTAPAVGLAAAIVLAWVAVRLPGDGLTAAMVLTLASMGALFRLRGRRPNRALPVAVATAAMTLAIVSLPFAANRRFGALGATINDDLALHLQFADSIARGLDIGRAVDPSYPIGPHSFVAAMSDLFGLGIEPALVGFIIAIPVLTALTALAALDELPARVQPIGATMVGICYLGVAYVAQASFKESVTALLVVGFTAIAREVLRDRARWRRWILPAVLLVLAGLSAFSIPSLAWFVAIASVVALATVLAEGIRPSGRMLGALAAAAVAVAGTVLVFELLTEFFSEGPGRYAFGDGSGESGGGSGGNLLGPLSPFEALGVWPIADFRLEPESEGWRLGVALAVVATSAGAIRMVLSRDLAVPAAAAASMVIWLVVDTVSIDYNGAKALAIAAPLLMLTAVGGLLSPSRRPAARLALAVLAAAFMVTAAASSLLPLRGGIVRPDSQSEALGELRDDVAGRPTIFLGRDNYAAWELRLTRIGYLGFGARAAGLGFRPPEGAAGSRGFDSLTTDELNSAESVIAPRTLYASLPGPELRLVRTTRWYRLYRRGRPSPERRVLDEGLEPGAVLRCSTPVGKRILRYGGRALVRPAPIVGRVEDWTSPSGRQPGPGSTLALTSNRGRIEQTLDLPPGRWEISLSWASSLPISFSAGSFATILPPYIADGDRHWRVASVRGGRPVRIQMAAGGERRIDVPRGAQFGTVVASREDVPARLVPVGRACGHYVDWVEP